MSETTKVILACIGSLAVLIGISIWFLKKPKASTAAADPAHPVFTPPPTPKE